MLIDVFPFFNELDILELRLRELDSMVRRFVAIQSTETHAGNEKPLYLDVDAPRWKPWRGRLETVVLPRIETTAGSVNERRARLSPAC
jgi:beta-1,4-mannosyl-glycoprotein beta-1,4-N-acetylglucosaminyltransferase